jgi:hypothetical protein
MYIVVKIRNNKLGKCLKVDSIENGIELIKGMVSEQLERELYDDELDILENDYEVFNDDDPENVYTWAIRIVK